MEKKAKDLQERVKTYFAACDATAERLVQKNGAIVYRQIPYTMAGLASHVGLSQQEIRRLAVSDAPGEKRAAAAMADAIRRIERYTIERALIGELNTSIVSLLLKDLGYGTTPEKEERIEILLDDREGWSE